jgi:hypothetical protein
MVLDGRWCHNGSVPPRLTKPTKVRDNYKPMIDMLWRFYVAAKGPSIRTIAQVIMDQDDDLRAGTANHETVRRTLKAMYLPEEQTVEVIFLALCEIASVDPDDDDDGDSYGQFDGPRTHRDRLHQCYRLARYGVVDDLPRTRGERAQQQAQERERVRSIALADDPWGSAPAPGSGGGYEEPPF